jgi:predicted nucleic acid-binding Zn ribbon protein
MEDDIRPPERCSICGEAISLTGSLDHAFHPEAREDFESQPPRDRAFQVALLVFLIIGLIVLVHR